MYFERFIGIDVAKHKLDIYDSGTDETFTIPNDKASIKNFLKDLPREKVLCIIENTGGYENLLTENLLKAGMALHKTDNYKMKAYMRSLGLKAKTDAIDAKALAQYGKERQDNLKLFQQNRKIDNKVTQLTRYLEDLKRMRAAEKNRYQSEGCREIRETIGATIKSLDELINKIEREIKKEVKRNNNEAITALTEYKGVSFTTAVNLLVYLPELGTVGSKEIAALAGVAPYAQDSGTMHGYRATRGGRPSVKKALFMAALSAIRFNEEISEFYARLLSTGKKPMVAIVACMRKILIHLNAITRILLTTSKEVCS